MDRMPASDTEPIVAPAQRAGSLISFAAALELQGVNPVFKCESHVASLL